MIKICKAEGCPNIHYAKGYCLSHYRKVQQYGRESGKNLIIDMVFLEDLDIKDKKYMMNIDVIGLNDTLLKVLNSLTEREKNILCLRFGLFGNDEHTLEQIGEIYGVCRAYIGCIIAKSLRKLRHPDRVKYIKDFMT